MPDTPSSPAVPASAAPPAALPPVRQIRAAGRYLRREAQRIMRRYGKRLPAEAAGLIDASVERLHAHLEATRWPEVHVESEALDELLHQHASFARKSALRETLENIAIAIGVALLLRSCVYEPYAIPSPSMVPTLRPGDHILVNKFVYGIQIPLTSTVVFQDWLQPIGRGDVVVFRYPIDPKLDFIKRVVGLPGDVVRVDGREVAIKRAGAEEFEIVERVALEQPCTSESAPDRVIERCTLFEETLDGKRYIVRYLEEFDAGPARLLEVPPGHLLVMGDNRNVSSDSLAWTAKVEAVSASALLSPKDLRDLTALGNFTTTHPLGEQMGEGDPNVDHVLYLGERIAPDKDIELEVWRDPAFGAQATVHALAAELDGARTTRLTRLDKLAHLSETTRARFARWDERLGPLEVGRGPLSTWADAVVQAPGDAGHVLVAALPGEPWPAVFVLRCGPAACPNEARAGTLLVDALDAYEADSDADARAMLLTDHTVRRSAEARSREGGDERVHRVEYRRSKRAEQAADRVALWAFRTVDEGTQTLVRAAIAAYAPDADAGPASGGAAAQAVHVVAEPGGSGWLLTAADEAAQAAWIVWCGASRCPNEAAARELATAVDDRARTGEGDLVAFRRLLRDSDVAGWTAIPVEVPRRYGWDRVTSRAYDRGGEATISVLVQRYPEDTPAAKAAHGARVDAHAATGTGQAIEGSCDAAVWADAPAGGMVAVGWVSATQAVLEIECGPAICASAQDIRALVGRACDKARDGSYIDPNAQRARPFVPRGNVKGRADRIWLPWERFWLPIR